MPPCPELASLYRRAYRIRSRQTPPRTVACRDPHPPDCADPPVVCAVARGLVHRVIVEPPRRVPCSAGPAWISTYAIRSLAITHLDALRLEILLPFVVKVRCLGEDYHGREITRQALFVYRIPHSVCRRGVQTLHNRGRQIWCSITSTEEESQTAMSAESKTRGHEVLTLGRPCR